MNNLVHTLFLQHLNDHEKEQTTNKSRIDLAIKMAVSNECAAAAIGRAVLVTQQVANGHISEANCFYKAACILCATGEITDLAMAHMCVLQVLALQKDGHVLSSEYAPNMNALKRDTWNWYIRSQTAGASE